jgi:acetoin utilization protein AcuB
MSKAPVTIRRTDSIAEAMRLLKKEGIRQLPVTARGRLLGIVTDRDLRSAPVDAERVVDVMSVDAETVDADESVDAAAMVLKAHKINALPVLRAGKLVGILTTSDILDAFIHYSGAAEPSYRLIVVPAKRSSLESIRKIVEGTHSQVRWIRERDKARSREVQVRLVTNDIDSVAAALEAAGHTVGATITTPATPL